MSGKKQRLELTWIGKDERQKLEPRILLPDPEKSYANVLGSGGLFDNRLIFGDNLLALKALSADFLGQVRCIYIDPPYNTGAAFEQYDDGVEHSIWLSLIRDRLEILISLLRPDGSIWISVDDNEAHYLKVVCDELLGRKCFIADIAWRKRDGAPNDRKIGAVHEHVLVYGKTHDSSSKKTVAELAFNLMQRSEKADAEYRIAREPFGVDERGAFRKVDLRGCLETPAVWSRRD